MFKNMLNFKETLLCNIDLPCEVTQSLTVGQQVGLRICIMARYLSP